MRRIEMQKVLGQTVVGKLIAIGLPMDEDHTRRFVRVVLRMAARVLIDLKAPPEVFLRLATQCYLEELKAPEPSVIPRLPELSSGAEAN